MPQDIPVGGHERLFDTRDAHGSTIGFFPRTVNTLMTVGDS